MIQRDIGFEYELGDVDTYRRTGLGLAAVDTPLAKGEVIWHDAGFDVTADVRTTPRGPVSDLEIIVHAIDDRPLGSRSTMARVLRSVDAFLQRLERRGEGETAASQLKPGASPSVFFLTAATGRDDDRRVNIGRGQLQATAGLSMDALYAIRFGQAFNRFQQNDASLTQEQRRVRLAGLGEQRDHLNQHINAGGGADPATRQEVVNSMPALVLNLGLPGTTNTNHLAAIVSLLVTIPIAARENQFEYAKGFAGTLMARTDFATIIGLLPQAQQDAIASHPNQWIQGLVGIVDRVVNPIVQVQQNDPVFPAGSMTDPNAPYGITLAEWYGGLAQMVRVDRLTQANYPGHHPINEATGVESLGGFGARMDRGDNSRLHMGPGMAAVAVVGTASLLHSSGLISQDTAGYISGVTAINNMNQPLLVRSEVRNRPVFEFRSLGSVPRPELVESGLALWDYVDIAHGRSQSYVSLSTAARMWNLAASFF